MRPLSIPRSYSLLTAAAVLACPGLAVACSGADAREAILGAEQLGWISWVATSVIAVGSALIPRMRARGWRSQWPLLLLVALHPGWWMSARSGDCGRTLTMGSIGITALTLLVAALLFWRSRRTA